MSDRDPPVRTYGLGARLDRLERELERLGTELAEVRALLSSPGTVPVHSPAPPVETPAPDSPVEPPLPPAPVRDVTPAVPKAPSLPPQPPKRTLDELARDWDLVGARGFAIAGGAVMALGIGLFFVLAANRGWIDERARVALGATASALVFAAGLLLRARYGQYLSALAAVAAGIAGAYATLAAATVRYDLVPDGLALPLAGVIAVVGTVVASRWESQVIAAIGLLGAALAPALQALDTEMTWESAAFALIVLVAATAVSVPRHWTELLVAASVIVGSQIEWLLLETDNAAGTGTIGVAATFVLVLISISISLQLVRGRTDLDPAALAYALLATGAAYVASAQLFEERADRGMMLFALSAVWGLVFSGLQLRRFPDLALVVGSAALALTAVGTADLVSDAVLTLAFSAQAVLLAVLAVRLKDVRLQVMSIGYATLAAIHVLAVEARFDLLFDEDADRLDAVLPLAATAAAFAVAGALAPEGYVARTESGLLSFVAKIRVVVGAHRRGLREALTFAAAVLGTLAASFALVSASFERGHVAATVLAAAVGAGILGLSGVRGSDPLAFAAYYFLGLVLVEALVFDADEFSAGGWSVIAVAAGLLAGAYAHRLLSPGSGTRDAVCGVGAAVAAVAGAIGVAVVADSHTSAGLGLLAVTVVYVGLAAGVFSRPGFRNVSTPLWSLGLLFLIAAELVLIWDDETAMFVVAVSGGAVAILSRPLGESRLWLAGAAVVALATSVTVLISTPPSQLFDASETPAENAWVLVGCSLGLVAVALSTRVDRHRSGCLAVTGGVALYALSLGILGIAERVSTASVETDFERGHTALSALWALVGLTLLIVGLLRGSAAIRYGGLALFGLSLAKIFLYDLSELSSVARAFSFIFVGALLLAGGFFLQRLSDRLGSRSA